MRRAKSTQWISATLAASILGFPLSVSAEIYKYKKSDGTVIYTDNLAQLPPTSREFYNKQREEREAKRRQLEKAVGRDEVERREAEAKRAELQRAQMEEAERSRRIAAIDEQLKTWHIKDKGLEAEKTKWQRRMSEAKARLARELEEFKAATEEYNTIAIKPSYTLLPGENEKLEAAKKRMDDLEIAIDRDVLEVEVTIPEEARKAGIPPGWIR